MSIKRSQAVTDNVALAPIAADEIKKTTCYRCACRCGIRVYLKDGEVKYIDGNPDGSRSTTAVITNDYQLRIGSNEEIPGTDWRGLIGEVKVYNIALSESEISEMANEYFGFAYKPTPADGENCYRKSVWFSTCPFGYRCRDV